MENTKNIEIKATLNNRTILSDGTVILHDSAILDMFHRDKEIDLTKLTVLESDEVKEYNKHSLLFGYNKINTEVIYCDKDINTWYIPDDYKDLDIETYLIGMCDTDEKRLRVAEELVMFKDRDMYPLLRYLVYLTDLVKKEDIIWGIGRGSSVSSYCLYLIGVHKVDALKYNLDITEFLK